MEEEYHDYEDSDEILSEKECRVYERDSVEMAKSSFTVFGLRSGSSKSVYKRGSRGSSREILALPSASGHGKSKLSMARVEEEIDQPIEMQARTVLSNELTRLSSVTLNKKDSHFLRKSTNLLDFNAGISHATAGTSTSAPIRLENDEREQELMREKCAEQAQKSRFRKKRIRFFIINERFKKQRAPPTIQKRAMDEFGNIIDCRSFGLKPILEKTLPRTKQKKQKKKKKRKVVKRQRETQITPEEKNWGFVQGQDAGTDISDRITSKEDLVMKTYFQSLFFYVIYLVLLTIIAVGWVDTNVSYYRKVTTELCMNTPNVPNWMNDSEPHVKRALKDACTVEDFWAFAETTMIKMLHWDYHYPEIETSESENNERKMFNENKILGLPRIRQVRVTSDSCQIHPKMQKFFNECYAYYSVYSEDTKPIKLGMDGTLTSTAWVYTDAKAMNSVYYWGVVSIYGGGGYYLDLGKTYDETIKMVKELKENKWVSVATRVVFIDFSLYNANVNYFCVCKIVLEFPPFGGIIPIFEVHPLKFLRYLSGRDFFFLACEILLIPFMAYFIFDLVMIGQIQDLSALLSFWVAIEIIIIMLGCIYLILALTMFIGVYFALNELKDSEYKHLSYENLSIIQNVLLHVASLLLFFSWINLLKFCTYNNTVLEFHLALKRSIIAIFEFFPMFLSTLMAFGKLGYILFGTQIKEYSTLWSSILTNLQIFTGTFRITELEFYSPIMAPIFYIGLILACIFLMAVTFLGCISFENLFLAIVLEVYRSIKSTTMIDTPLTAEYWKRGFLNTLHYCCCHLDKKFQKRTVWEDKYKSIQTTLKRAGFTNSEIQAFFAKYNIDPNNILLQTTKNRVLQDLETNYLDFTETTEQFQYRELNRRMNDFSEKIDEIEASLQPVIDKVDLLVRNE